MAPRIVSLLAVGMLLLGGVLGLARPWYLAWGATDEELHRVLPGDEIIPGTSAQLTRAITIDAPIERVWPWLAQLGQDRGGFYSFDLLENAVGCEMPTTDVLRPDRQRWAVGDKLWMYPPRKAGGSGFATLRTFVPGRAMGFGTHMPGVSIDQPEDGSWSFVLEPLGSTMTRLLVRGRGGPRPTLLGITFYQSVFEPVHFVMEKRMLIGIKQLAETGARDRASNHAQVALWVITALLMMAAVVVTLRAADWTGPLVITFGAGVLFAMLTLVQPPIWAGGALVLSLSAAIGAVVPRRR
jgi:hypothetical protein